MKIGVQIAIPISLSLSAFQIPFSHTVKYVRDLHYTSMNIYSSGYLITFEKREGKKAMRLLRSRERENFNGEVRMGVGREGAVRVKRKIIVGAKSL